MVVMSADVKRPFSAVVKPSGAACNINCEYCFFLSKELLFDEHSQRMSDEELENFIRLYLDAQPDGDVELPWQGGEPTLRGVAFFERASELVEKYRRPHQHVHQSIQTNATLIDDNWGEFLSSHEFLVGVSMDGPARLHNKYRVDRRGRGTLDKTLRGWHILEKYGVNRTILCTVNSANSHYPLEVYRFFRDELHAQYMQFIPIVERVTEDNADIAEHGWRKTGQKRILYTQKGSDVTSRTVRAHDFGTFLSAIFDEWSRRDVGQVSVQHFDSMLDCYFGAPTFCVHSPTCGNDLAVMHNGDVYSCDHFVEPGYKLGNLSNEDFLQMMASPQQKDFGERKLTGLSPICEACPVKWMCWGGCPKDRFVRNEDGSLQNYLCEGYRDFFTQVLPVIVKLARGLAFGKSPESLMSEMKENSSIS
ncbi:MAG: anaerobic sulfatase maturase [Bifidobacteriaceae bacterium]|jgi:uncharacterized protein|nr:anaerobic sulfatase maturase [Bifidobacteriaceae bacterium]